MGTKNEPGAFDCYANAEPDEPMFILLGRDKRAPERVEEWANEAAADGEDPAKVAEARLCAQSMRVFRARRMNARRKEVAVPLAAKMGCTTLDAETALYIAADSPEVAERLIRATAASGISIAALGSCFA